MAKKSRSFSNVILNPVLNLFRDLFQNLYRFQAKPGMTRRARLPSFSFFPHISLKKTAGVLNRPLKLCFLLFVVCFLFLNLHAYFFPENEKLDQALKRVLNYPFQSKSHELLAKIYLEMGQVKMAQKELSLAKKMSSPDLISIEELEDVLEKTKKEPETIRQEISFWEKVVQEKPDYRDAYFQLAVLNYKIGNHQQAEKWLNKVFELDPAFEPAQELEKLLHL